MSSSVANSTESISAPARNAWPNSPGTRTFLLTLLLAVGTVAAYYPVHRAPFINYDDNAYVTENAHVNKGLSWATVKWSFVTFHASNWHPLTWLSHATDCQLFQLNPGAHHDVNVFLHVVNVLLLFWVLQRATGYSGRSFVVAALFALHPLNVESVAWVAERKTMLSMLFFLLALGVYRWYALAPRAGRYLTVALLFLLGLMAKPQIITLPFVLLLWDYWPLQRMFSSTSEAPPGTRTPTPIPARSFFQLIWEKVPLFFLIAVDSLVTMKAQRVGRPSTWTYTLWTRLANAIVAYASYLGKMFWPSRLALLYPHPGNTLGAGRVLGASLLLIIISVFVAINRKRRYLVVGWLWFLGTMVPMVGIVQVGRQAMADRYAYLPFVGLFIMICWGAADLARQRRLPTAVLAGATVVVLLALLDVTHHQVGYWLDDVKLWEHTLEVTGPKNWYAEARIGEALLKGGLRSEALPHFDNVLVVQPNEPISNLGVALFEHEHGELADAIVHYKKALAAMDADDNNRYQVLVNMGYVYKKLGDNEDSRECFEAAAKLQSH